MISLDEALALLLEGIVPGATEQVALAEAIDRVLAGELVATTDQPAAAVSAMDGFAVRDADARQGAELEVIGSAFAGAPFAGEVRARTAVRIATGGVIPAGAERVIMQEAVSQTDGRITIVGGPSPARFVRPAGDDFERGDVLLQRGERMGPAQIGLAAAAGFAQLMVSRRPRVTLFASGDELRAPGAPLAPGEAYDSAGPAVAALVGRWGGTARFAGVLPDDRRACVERIGAMIATSDVLLLIGGASVGERDVIKPAVADLGAHIRFDKIAIQPGKPAWHGRIGGGPLILGLPGNPASAFVCAHLLLEPLLAALQGTASRCTTRAATLAAPLPAGGAREMWWRARLDHDHAGTAVVRPDLRTDSSLQRALADANALIRRRAGVAAASAGEIVDVLMLQA